MFLMFAFLLALNVNFYTQKAELCENNNAKVCYEHTESFKQAKIKKAKAHLE